MNRSTMAGLREVFGVTGLVLAVLAAGCSTTQQVQVGEQAAQRSCAFLGNTVCGELTSSDAPGRLSSAGVTGASTVPGLRYLNPNAQWTHYTKVLLMPVTFWGGDSSSVAPADQQSLTNYFYQVLQQQLATKFQLVQEPGPGVMTVQVALTDVEKATPILRTISMVVPQARALATLKYLATGTYAFVGGATAELKILDSLTHQVLAAAVDKRVGGGSIATAAQWQMGDAQNAMTAWAQQMTTRLSALTSGTSQS